MTRPRPPGGPTDPCWTSGRASRPVPNLWEDLTTRPRPPGGPPDPSWTSGRAFRPVPDLQKGLQTRPGMLEGPTNPSRTSVRASRPVLNFQEGLPNLQGAYRTSGMASLCFWDLRESLQTCTGNWKDLQTSPGPLGRTPDLSRTFEREF